MTALPVAACPTEAELEFDRQVDALAMTGLPERSTWPSECFRASVEPLRDLLPDRRARRRRHPVRRGRAATCRVVPVLEAVQTVGGAGFTTMDDDDLARFRPLPELAGADRPVPAGRRRPGRGHPEPPPAEVLPRLAAPAVRR